MTVRNILLSLLCLAPLWGMAQAVSFPVQAKFILQDDSAFRDPAFNDAAWQSVAIPAGWTKLGLNRENSTGWYRIRLDVPERLLNKELVIFAGTIDDADETYFNGHRIGASGKFPPGDQSAWDVERKYTIRKEWVQAHNVIAIRVYNGIGDGGLYGGRTLVMLKSEYDRQVAAQIRRKKSYYQLTTSNGLIAAVYNEQSRSIENLFPHIFSYYDSGLAVQPVISNLRLKKEDGFLGAAYLANTHIIKARYQHFNLYYFTSFTNADKILYIMAEGDEPYLRELAFDYTVNSGRVQQKQTLRTTGYKAEKYFLFGFADTLNTMPDMEAALHKTESMPLMQNELAFMRNLFASCHLPAKLTPAERNVAEQSLCVLKMSQVGDKEVFPHAPGQVMASLRPGVWAISWVRDGSLAIEAMSKAGMYTEARKALEFMLMARPTDQYIHYWHTDGKDYGIGVPYIISVTRYFGNGREESDYTSSGPNIEIDDFGLFLTAFYHYVQQSGDSSFFREWKEKGLDVVARAIIANINDKGVIRTESGPWEHHLPGKEFMWTSGACARGLQLIGELCAKYHYDPQLYNGGASRLYEGIMKNGLVDNRYIKGNATEQHTTDHHYFDGGTFELFASGLINNRALFASHLQEYNKHLRAASDPERGYIRFNSSDSYENQEWPVAGLRVAVAEMKMGDPGRAKKLIGRITAYAAANNGLIPEILSNEMSMYKGAIPMVGYGAGAYLLALFSYYGK